MLQQKIQNSFFLVLFIGAGILTFFVFQPYLLTLFLAITFAVIFTPINRRLLVTFKNRGGWAAFVTTVLVFFVVMLPLLFIGFQIFQESRLMYTYLTSTNNSNDLFYTIIQKVQHSVNRVLPQASLNVAQVAQQIAQWMVQHLGSIFSQLFSSLANFFLFLLALYYLLKDGEQFKKQLIQLSPLDNRYDQHIIDKLGRSINSVIGGSLIIALIQGTLSGIGFFIFGIPNAVLWGTVAAFAALVPSVGTSLVLGPGILYLFLTGELFQAVGLLLWGGSAVGLIDNFLGPKIISKGSHIHSFAILLSVLGGIKLFGLVGFIIGPFILTLLVALTNIYSALIQRKPIE